MVMKNVEDCFGYGKKNWVVEFIPVDYHSVKETIQMGMDVVKLYLKNEFTHNLGFG